MEKIKKLIIALLIIVVLILAIKFIVNKIHSRNEDYDEYIEEFNYVTEDIPVDEKNASNFYAIESCIQRYLDYTTYDAENSSDSIEYINSCIYKLLDEDFISANSITVDNVNNTISLINTSLKFKALKMKSISYKNGLLESRVYGKLCDKITGEVIEYAYYRVLIDNYNITFSVEPLFDCNNIDDIPVKDYGEDKRVKYNSYNQFYYFSIDDDILLNRYFDYIKEALLHSPEEIYNLLESEYKNKNFPTIDSFKDFINDNKTIIEEMKLKEYKTEDMIVSQTFTCEDYNQKTYVIDQDAIMNFSLIINY